MYFPRFTGSPVDVTGCILVDGHGGRHVFNTEDGKAFEWEPDRECQCETCMNGEIGDECCIYEEHQPTADAGKGEME
jgi:hypothetical protein